MKGCRSCGEPIAWTKDAGRNVPVDPATGERHECKGVVADRLKKPTRHHVSASAIERHEECQERFWHERIGETKGEILPREEADAGKLAHSALEGVFVERAPTRRGIPLAWSEVETALERAAGREPWTNGALLLATEILHDAVAQKRIDLSFAGSDEHGPLVERGFEIPLGEGAVAGGVLDLVEFIGNVANVRDWKTGGWRDPSPASSPQVGLYGLYARAVWSTKDVRVTIQYLALGEEDEVGGRDLDRAIALASALGRGLVAKMRAKGDDRSAWPATFGAHCGYCPFTAACATYQERTKAAPPSERPVIELGLAEIAAELHRIEPAASLYEKRVKALRSRGKILAGARVGSDGRALVGRWPILLRTENVKAHERQASTRQILKIGDPIDIEGIVMLPPDEPAKLLGGADVERSTDPLLPIGPTDSGPPAEVVTVASDAAPLVTKMPCESGVPGAPAGGDGAGPGSGAMPPLTPAPSQDKLTRAECFEGITMPILAAALDAIPPAEWAKRVDEVFSRSARDDPRPGDRVEARGIAYEVLTVDGGGEDIGVKISDPGRAPLAEHFTLDLWRRTCDATGDPAPTPSGPVPPASFHSASVAAWLGAGASAELVARTFRIDDKATDGDLQADVMTAIQATHGKSGLLDWFAHAGVIIGGDVNGARMRRAFAKPTPPPWFGCPSCGARIEPNTSDAALSHRCEKDVPGGKITTTIGPTCCACGSPPVVSLVIDRAGLEFLCAHAEARRPHEFCASCSVIASAKGATPVPALSREEALAILGGTEAWNVVADLFMLASDESLGAISSTLLARAAKVHGKPAMEAAWLAVGGHLSGGEKPRRIALTVGQGKAFVQALGGKA